MECLFDTCDNTFESKTGRRKFCSDSCKMKYYRKHGKKDVATKFDMQMLINEFKSVIQELTSGGGIVFQPILPNPAEVKSLNNAEDYFIDLPEPKKIVRTKSVIEYVKARMECPDAESYQLWLEEVENDENLSDKDKKDAKNNIL